MSLMTASRSRSKATEKPVGGRESASGTPTLHERRLPTGRGAKHQVDRKLFCVLYCTGCHHGFEVDRSVGLALKTPDWWCSSCLEAPDLGGEG